MSKTTLTNRYDVTTRDEVNQLAVGDRIEVTHEVKVGQQRWYTTTAGTVERIERRRQGLHYQRNFDDKAFCDLVVLRLDDSSLTTLTFDEFSQLKVVSRAKS